MGTGRGGHRLGGQMSLHHPSLLTWSASIQYFPIYHPWYLMTKGINLNRDTKDLIMLVMDEKKKVVNFCLDILE